MKKRLLEALRQIDRHYADTAVELRSNYNALVENSTCEWYPAIQDGQSSCWTDDAINNLIPSALNTNAVTRHREVRKRLAQLSRPSQVTIALVLDDYPLGLRNEWMTNLTRDGNNTAYYSVYGLVKITKALYPEIKGKVNVKAKAVALLEIALEEYVNAK